MSIQPGPPDTAAASAVAEEVAAPAPHYAALFVLGAAWSYRVTASSQMPDNPDPAADPDGIVKTTSEVHCKVTRVASFARGVLSQMECSEPLELAGRDVLSGVWAATERGLWHLDETPEEGARPLLLQDQMVISSRPVERAHQTGNEEMGSRKAIVGQGDTWCISQSAWGGDESWSEICFGPSGVISGESGWAGGSVHETRFELLR